MICWKLAEKTLNAAVLNLILSSGIQNKSYVGTKKLVELI